MSQLKRFVLICQLFAMGNQKMRVLHGYICQLVVKIRNAVLEIEPERIRKTITATKTKANVHKAPNSFLTMGLSGFSARTRSNTSKLSGEGLSREASKENRHLEGI